MERKGGAWREKERPERNGLVRTGSERNREEGSGLEGLKRKGVEWKGMEWNEKAESESKSMMTHEHRYLLRTLDKLAAGKVRSAVTDLCALLRVPVPEIRAPRKPASIVALPPRPTDHALRSQPKSPPRIIDPAARRRYRERVQTCEVIGCGLPGVVHHIRTRGRHGDDVESNCLLLCNLGHHLGRKGLPGAWHAYATDAERWAAFRAYLLPAARAKVAAALGIGDDPHDVLSTGGAT